MHKRLRAIRNAILPYASMTVKENKNMSFEQVETIVSELLDGAERTIDWGTGLYTISHSTKVATSLQNAAARGIDIRILLDEPVEMKAAKRSVPWLFDLARDEKIELRKSENPIPHQLMVDEKNMRLEMPHDPSTWGHNNHVFSSTDRRMLLKLIRK